MWRRDLDCAFKQGDIFHAQDQRFAVCGPILGGSLDDPFRFRECILARDWTRKAPTEAVLVGLGVGPEGLRAWPENYKAHQPHIKKGVCELFDSWQDKTVMIVGSGPGLMLNGQKIRKHPNLKIIAVNNALQWIDPDVVDLYGCFDWHGNPAWFDGIEDKIRHIPLVAGVVCDPKVLAHFDEVYHFSTSSMPAEAAWISDQTSHLGLLESGLSVLYSMFHLAWKMGAKTIVFAGADSAYSMGMAYPYQSVKWRADRHFEVVPDIYGNAVITEHTYKSIAALISAQARFLKEADPNMVIVNATESGILKENLCVCALDDVYENFLT